MQQCLQQGRLFNMTPRCELACFQLRNEALIIALSLVIYMTTHLLHSLVTDPATIYHSVAHAGFRLQREHFYFPNFITTTMQTLIQKNLRSVKPIMSSSDNSWEKRFLLCATKFFFSCLVTINGLHWFLAHCWRHVLLTSLIQSQIFL